MKRFIIILAIQLLYMACSVFEPDDKIYYHNVGAEGYVYYQDKPVPNADIIVEHKFKSQPLAVKPSIDKYFKSDATGYFYVNFIKRIDHHDVKKYAIMVGNDSLTIQPQNKEFSITLEILLNSKTTIQLGRINLEKAPL